MSEKTWKITLVGWVTQDDSSESAPWKWSEDTLELISVLANSFIKAEEPIFEVQYKDNRNADPMESPSEGFAMDYRHEIHDYLVEKGERKE